jgi:hypothetical protein
MSSSKSVKYLASAAKCLLTGTKNESNIDDIFVEDRINFLTEKLEANYINADEHFAKTLPYDENNNDISRANIGIINNNIDKCLHKNILVKNIIKNSADGKILSTLKDTFPITSSTPGTKVIIYTIDHNEPTIVFYERRPDRENMSINTFPEYASLSFKILYEKFQERREIFANSSFKTDTMFDITFVNDLSCSGLILYLTIDTFIKGINNTIIGIHTLVKLDLVLEQENTIPYPLTQYINQVNSTLKKFVNGEEDQITTLNYGSVSNINELKVIESATNPEWNNKYINELNMNGINFDVRELFTSIIRELNNDYDDYNIGDTSISLIKILDVDFLTFNKIIISENKKILQLYILNISEILVKY